MPDTKEYKLTLKIKISEAAGQAIAFDDVAFGPVELLADIDFDAFIKDATEKLANSLSYHFDRIK